MPKKVTAKQHNSRMCFVCGLKNHAGLKASFYEMEGEPVGRPLHSLRGTSGLPG